MNGEDSHVILMALPVQVDVMLRHVAGALLAGNALTDGAKEELLSDVGPSPQDDRSQLASCLAYLRDRVRHCDVV